MTEVDYGGGGHRTRLRTMSVVCSRVPPAPVYKGARGEAGRPLGHAKEGRSPSPSRSRSPPFLVQLGGGRGKEGEGEREEREGAAPLLVQFGLPRGGGSPRPSPLSPTRPMLAH